MMLTSAGEGIGRGAVVKAGEVVGKLLGEADMRGCCLPLASPPSYAEMVGPLDVSGGKGFSVLG